jgi:hypothetical protein
MVLVSWPVAAAFDHRTRKEVRLATDRVEVGAAPNTTHFDRTVTLQTRSEGGQLRWRFQ